MARLRMLGDKLVVGPLPMPKASEAANITFVTKYFDDDSRWQVLQAGPQAKDIKEGDRVILSKSTESLYDFADRVKIIHASDVIMTW